MTGRFLCESTSRARQQLAKAGGHGELKGALRADALQKPKVDETVQVGTRRGVSDLVGFLMRLDAKHRLRIAEGHLQHGALPMIDVYVVSQRAHERLITFEHAFELRFDLVQLLAHQTRRHVDVMV